MGENGDPEVLQVFPIHTGTFNTDLPHNGALDAKQDINSNATPNTGSFEFLQWQFLWGYIRKQ